MKKFYLLLVALCVAIAANAVDYYLIGGFNGWSLKQASCKFTAQGDGTYVLNYNGTLTSGFKINDGTWSNDANNFGGNGNLIPGTVYNLTSGGSSGNIGLSENIENPKLTFNPTAKTLLIEGQTVEAEYSYSIRGSMFTGSWTDKDLVEKDGKWVLENATSVGGDFGIRKNDKSTGAQVNWINSANGAEVTLNTAMPAAYEKTGTINWTIGAGTFTYTFDPEAMTLTVTGEGGDVPTPETFYWSGDLTGTWEFNNAIEGADGIYTADLNVTGATGYVTITSGLMVNWAVTDGVRYGAGSADVTVVSGTTYNMVTGSDKCWVLAKGKYTLTVDAAALKVTFTKEGGDDPLPSTIYWNGNITGEWEFNNAIEGTDGIYTASMDVTGTKGFITITTGKMVDWQVEDGVRYGAASEDPIVSETAYEMVPGTDKCWVLNRASYSMTVDMNTMKIKFVKTGEIEDPEEPEVELYVVGSFCGWGFEEAPKMEQTGNVYTANIGNIDTETLFKISTNDWKYNFGAGETTNITENTSIDAWFNSSENFVLAPEEGKTYENVQVTFTLVEGSGFQGSAIPATIKLSWNTTGVEAIVADENAEAVYYNMQGVKVANPTSGLYIKVAGNKATKVAL